MKNSVAGLIVLVILVVGSVGIFRYGSRLATTMSVGTTSISTSLPSGTKTSSSTSSKKSSSSSTSSKKSSSSSSMSSMKSSSSSSTSSKKSSSSSSLVSKPCCACIYYNVDCAKVPKEKCDATTDCAWWNGACVPRFQKMCDQWISSQPSCSEKIVQVESAPAPALDACTEVTFQRMGHGYSCKRVSTIINTCLQSCKNATCTSYTDIGCSVADNMDDARKMIEDLQKKYAKEGRTINITVNQTVSSYPICETWVKFTLTASAKQESYMPCNPGGFCFVGALPMQCEENGTIISQKCCVGPKQGFWSEHGKCPPCTDYYGDVQELAITKWEPGKECKNATEQAIDEAREKIRIAREKCVGDISILGAGWPPEPQITVGKNTCTATVKVKYRCIAQCPYN